MDTRLSRGIACGAAAGALWGLVFLAPQVAGDFGALQLAAGRYLVYGAVAVLLLAPRWHAATAAIGRAEWWALVRLSLLGNIVYYVLLALAVRWAGGAAASLIIGLLPVAVTLVGTREAGALRLRALAGPLALCVAGVGLVGAEALAMGGDAADRTRRMAGLLCAFAAMASWAAYSVVNSRWLARRPDISAHDWSLLTGVVTGACAVVLAVPAFAPTSGSHGSSDWLRFWAVAATVAVLASVVGNGLWNRASRLLPLTLTGQMIVFETLFALLYGFAWEQRWPSVREALAIVCLIGGVWWCARAHRVPATPPAA